MRKLLYQWYVFKSDLCAQQKYYISCDILTSGTSVSLLHILSSIHVTLKVQTEGVGGLGASWLYNVPSPPRCYNFHSQNLECFVLPLYLRPKLHTLIWYPMLSQNYYWSFNPHVTSKLYLKFHAPNTKYFFKKSCEKCHEGLY